MKVLKNLLNNFWQSPNKWRNSIPYLLVIGFFVFLGFSLRTDLEKNSRSVLEKQTAQISSPFENIKLEARAAYVFDVSKNQAIFELNSETRLPLASLTKIMTALSAREVFPSSLLVTIPKEAVLQEGDEGFIVGEEWPVYNLTDAMLISSSNDAAFTLALEFYKDFNEDFVSLMNKKAEELGLTQTYFFNATGLDLSENTSGAYGSAKDIAKLLLYTMKNHPSLMEITRSGVANINGRKFKNTNQIINELPGFVAGKTGFSDLAGGNLGVMVDKGFGQPFIIVVLGSTYDGRFSDVKTLYNLIP
jgi:D-alanyl-D-alanine carboxypeptidase (penicillin-binding protein 5/6)